MMERKQKTGRGGTRAAGKTRRGKTKQAALGKGETQASCPLCSDKVTNLEAHLNSVHSDNFCRGCNVLKQDKDDFCAQCDKDKDKGDPCTQCDILQPIVKLEEGDGPVITEIKVEVVEELGQEDGANKTVEGATKCQHCNQWFHNKDSALIHRVISHSSPYCFPCDAVFEDVAQLENHVRATHREIKCDQCQKVFAGKLELAKHRAAKHQVFACKFCDDQFPALGLAAHKAKTHRVEMFSSPSVQEYYAPTVHLFDPLLDATKVKCCLCKKEVSTSRLIDHVKFFHNVNNPAVIRGLRGSTVKFDFSMTNLSIVNQPNNHLKETEKSKPRALDQGQIVDGEEVYECLLCHESFQDQGAHLLLEHGFLRCPTCPTFLPATSLARHRASKHSATKLAQHLSSMASFPSTAIAATNLLTCSVCEKTLPSPFSLLTHRHAEHKLYTCILCDAIILTALKPFLKHMMQHHLVTSTTLTTKLKTEEETTPTFATATLARVDRSCQQLDCLLCDEATFEGPTAGSAFVAHLTNGHHVANPAKNFFPLFDGTEFSYKTLALSSNDLPNLGSISHQQLQKPIPQPPSQPSRAPENLVQLLPPAPPVAVHVPQPLVLPVQQGPEPQRRVIRVKSMKRKSTTPAPSQTSTSGNNACIICARTFATSEEVQRHLLTVHVNRREEEQETGKAEETINVKQEVEEKEEKEEEVLPEVKQEESIEVSQEEAMLDDEMEEEGDDDEEPDIQIDEEHYSINHVEVNIAEKGNEPLNESDYCPIIDDNICIVDQDKAEEEEEMHEDDDEEEEEEEVVLPLEEVGQLPMEVVGEVGKAPIYLKCQVCSVVLPSILAFTNHMRREHKDSEQERNKPFSCEICGQGFYFLSSRNSHQSKAHRQTTGPTFRCPLCPSVTNSKNGMRRHLRNSHKRTDLLNEELSYKCKHCGDLFWSIAERTKHISGNHPDASAALEKCFLCLHISPNRHALRRHFQRMHPNQPLFESVSFKCADCGLLFPQRQLLASHVRAEHPKAVSFQCAHCPTQLKNKKSLEAHIGQHREAGEKGVSYTCNMCQKEFASRKALKTHFSASHSDKAKKGFICKVCNKVLETANARSLHYKVDHPDSNPYVCSVCSLAFVTKSSLYNHRMSHKSKKQHKCDYCGKEFNRRDSFNEHVLIHIGPRHKCPHCPKEFVQKSNLKRHIRIHLGIKPYKCQFCEMTFSDKGACNSHQRTHTGEERAACPICQVVFSKKQKLKYHMRIHTGEGLETCHICGKVFTHSYALNVHLRTHSKENQFMCHECKKIFQNGEKLYKHVTTHGKVKLSCSECPATFRFSKLLNRHVMAAHKEMAGLQCSAEQCNLTFKRLTEVRDHVRAAHSVKHPVAPTHYSDLYLCEPLVEVNLDQIYESLDKQIDDDVLKPRKTGKKATTKKTSRRKNEEEEEEMEVKEEEEEDGVADVKSEPP